LSGVLADKTIAQMASQGDPATACASLIELTLQAGAPDNVTVGIISVSEREEENADLPSTREFNTVTSKSNGIEAHLR
jgi:serine/threonine protein phosphatase PrpC